MAGRGTHGARNVAFTNPGEPAFLRRLKEQIGYKAPATIDDKRVALPSDGDDNDDDESCDAGPLIVQLKDGDLSADDVQKIKDGEKQKEEREKIDRGEITFRKPLGKRAADDLRVEEEAAKRQRSNDEPEKSKSINSGADIDASKQPSRLLSFQDDEDEADDDT